MNPDIHEDDEREHNERVLMLYCEAESVVGLPPEQLAVEQTVHHRFLTSLYLGILFDCSANGSPSICWGYHGSMILCTILSSLTNTTISDLVTRWQTNGLLGGGVIPTTMTMYMEQAIDVIVGKEEKKSNLPIDECLPRCLASVAMLHNTPRKAMETAINLCKMVDDTKETLDVVRCLVCMFLGIIQGKPSAKYIAPYFVPDGIDPLYWDIYPVCPAVARVIKTLPGSSIINGTCYKANATTRSILDALPRLKLFEHAGSSLASLYGLFIGAVFGTPDPRIHSRGSLLLEDFVYLTLNHAWVYSIHTNNSMPLSVDAYNILWTLYCSSAELCHQIQSKAQLTIENVDRSQKPSGVYASIDAYSHDALEFQAQFDQLNAAMAPPQPVPVLAKTLVPTAATEISNLLPPADAPNKAKVKLPQLTKRNSVVQDKGSLSRFKSGPNQGVKKTKHRGNLSVNHEEEMLKSQLRHVLIDRYAELRLSIKAHFQKQLDSLVATELSNAFKRHDAISAWAARDLAAKQVVNNVQRSHVYDSKMMAQVRLHKSLPQAMQQIFYPEMVEYNRLFNLFLDTAQPLTLIMDTPSAEMSSIPPATSENTAINSTLSPTVDLSSTPAAVVEKLSGELKSSPDSLSSESIPIPPQVCDERIANESIPLTEPPKSTNTTSSVDTTATNESTIRSTIEISTTKTHEDQSSHGEMQTITIHKPQEEHTMPVVDEHLMENQIRPSTHHRPGSAKKKLTRPEMIQHAKDLAAAEHLGAGKSFYRTTMKDIAELGVGLNLYFLFTKYMSGCFFVMTLLALPALIMHGASHGIDTQMIDPLRLSLYTIANEGVNSTSNATTQWCLDNPFTDDPITVSYIVTACDLLHSVAFALFIWYFQHTTKTVIAMQADTITPAKYAVYVRGLPRSATVESIVAHFNQRYNPTVDRKDYPMTLGCFGRGKSSNLLPNLTHSGHLSKAVSNTEHLVNDNPIYLNTHIAEVSIAHASGGLLRTFLAMEYLTAKVAELKDILSTLQASSDEVKSPKESKQREKNIAKFEKELEKVEMTLEKKTHKMKQLRSNGASYVDDCECAFVVFNSVEAQKRCLRDYRMSRYNIPRQFQPKELQFEGKYPLKVRQAPEPSNIMWENLEVPSAERRLRRYFTNFITFLLLLLSCGVISLAQSAQAKFTSVAIPNFCNEALPAIFTGNYSNISKSSWSLYWNQFPTDVTCPTGSYYISYINKVAVKVPAVGNATQCLSPCLSAQSNLDTTCSTLPCFKPQLEDIKTRPCTTYKASDMLKCYCEPALAKAIKLYGYIEGPRKMYNYELPCQEYLQQYLSKNAALFLAAGTVIVVNLFLQTILRAFADFERHVSESERTSAMVIKLFFAQLLNTGIIVLLVNANLTNIPLPSQVRDILHGQYSDFVRQWYISVGVGISTTMIINAISPQIGPFLKTYVIGPISRWYAIRSAVTQKQMIELYAGPPFDISLRYPLVLNTVFVTMMYCGGIPILLPVASLACLVMHQLDKLTMMKLYSVRTAYDEALGELSLSMLPFALLIHLGFSTWMYGNGTFLQSNLLNVQWVLQKVGFQSVGNATDVNALYEELQNAVSKYDPLGKNGLSSKIWRVNVFPVFLFFLLTILWLIVSKLFGYLLRPLFNNTLGFFLRILSLVCTSAAKSLKKILIKRKYSADHSIIAQYPDFTGEYQVMHLQKSKVVDTTKGFELQDNGVLIRKWTVDTDLRNKGDRMLTWEAMAAPVKTYDIEANPKYKNAVIELLNARRRLGSEVLKSEDSKKSKKKAKGATVAPC